MQDRWKVDNPFARGVDERRLRRMDIENQTEFVHELVRRLSAIGAPILAGTDSGVEGLFPGKSIHLELYELVSAGLTPQQAITAATSTPGKFFEQYVPRSEKLGQIKKGYVADLVLLDANPQKT